MKKIIVLCSAVAALTCAVTLHAQQVSGTTAPAQVAFRIFSITPLEARVVKGMPYSAEIATESIQTLADGNRIVQRTTGRVYRDSEGRVRREEDRPSDGPTVTITDPVAGTSFTLDPANRTARETPAILSIQLAQLVERARAAVVFAPGARGSIAQAPQPLNWARGRRGGPADGGQSEERLQDRAIEGVLASGVRRTTTIEKGAIGNEQPIKIVSEEWTSPELQVLVMTDFNDPRTGRSTYQLLKITRSDPDPGVFQVPADYSVQRMPRLAPAAAGARGAGAGGRGGTRGQ
ncbi:MAG: hypothetical protein WBD07_18030 [Vicinamibacterales bacterium]